MTYGEMVDFIMENPGVAVTHRLFDDHEFIFMANYGNVYDEQGYLFEDLDWSSQARNGIRIRDHGPWKIDWSSKQEQFYPQGDDTDSIELQFERNFSKNNWIYT